MIGIYLNPEECDYLSTLLADKLSFCARIPVSPDLVDELEYIKSLLSKLDYRNLEVNKSVVL